jgi:hypothetical protein
LLGFSPSFYARENCYGPKKSGYKKLNDERISGSIKRYSMAEYPSDRLRSNLIISSRFDMLSSGVRKYLGH